jgi:hypothetical protein
MNMLASNTGQLRQKMLEEARAGFQEGQGRMGIGQVLSKAIEELTKPVRAQFQKIGANMTQYYQDAVEDVSNQMMGGGPGFSPAQGQTMSSRLSTLTSTGNTQALGAWNQRIAGAGGGMGGTKWGANVSAPSGFAGRFAQNFMPTGLQIGNMQEGTGFGDLPGFGFGLSEYQGGQTALAMGSALKVFPGGRNALGAVGEGFGRAGVHITGGTINGQLIEGLLPSRQTGFMGLGGNSMPRGLGRMAGGGLRLGGAAMRGMGGLLGAAAVPLMAYDMVTNLGPEASRQYGMTGISQGAISGNNSRLLESLSEMGVFDDDSLSRRGVGGAVGGLDASSARSVGLTPVSGTYEANSGFYGGTQNFLTEAGSRAVDKLITGMGGDQSDLISTLGGKAHVGSMTDLVRTKRRGGGGYTDQDAMLEFMKETGATSEQAFMILGSQAPGKQVFEDKLKHKFDRGQEFITNPTKARDQVVLEVMTKSANYLVSVLQRGGTDAEETAQDTLNDEKQMKFLQALTGLSPGDLKEKLISASDGGKFRLKNKIESPYEGNPDAQARAAGLDQIGMQLLRGGGGFEEVLDKYRSQMDRGGKLGDLAGQMSAEMGQGHPQWNKLLGGDTADRLSVGGMDVARHLLSSKTDFAPSVAARTAGIWKGIITTRATQLNEERPRAGGQARAAAAAGGYSDLNKFRGALDLFTKGRGNMDSGFPQLEDYEQQAMSQVATMFQSGDMTEDGIDRAISSFAGGSSQFSQRAAVVGANVRYYTKQWENSKDSPVKFLANITHNPMFNKLTEREKNFLRGQDPTGLTTRLESMLEESAKDILRASGKDPTEAEVVGLADDMVRGATTNKASREKLFTQLSTQNNPVRPDVGRGGGGGQQAVDSVVSALGGLATKLENWPAWVNQSMPSYGK